MGEPAEPLGPLLHRTDRDRYLCALYAPEEKRGALLGLYAFNAEIASIRDRVSQALPGEIRLQWWRDAILGSDPGAQAGHPIAQSLRVAIARHQLPLSAFENYLEARIFDLYDDPMPSRTDLEGYCGETAGVILQLSALVLDAGAAVKTGELAGRAACAQAITGLLMLLPLHRGRGQCFVPRDILAAAGTTPEDFVARRDEPAAERAIAAMLALADEHLAAFRQGAGRLPPTLRPAYLPLALTEGYLRRMQGKEAALLAGGIGLPDWRRHWRLFRHASSGWR